MERGLSIVYSAWLPIYRVHPVMGLEGLVRMLAKEYGYGGKDGTAAYRFLSI